MTGILPLANATGDYSAYGTNTFDSSETFLRGGWHTDTNGMVEITTVFPGFYTGRTTHVHIMVHKDWTQSDNGFVNGVPSISEHWTDSWHQHARIPLR